jgi:hypothetical protein
MVTGQGLLLYVRFNKRIVSYWALAEDLEEVR